MKELINKLNYKPIDCIHIINLPLELNALSESFDTKTRSGLDTTPIDFLMLFTIRKSYTEEQFNILAPLLSEDALVWMCYPKGTSKKYTCDFNRDNGWEILGRYGYEPVRMISINEDWSALRFRKVAFIKKMTRSFALTDEGKQKIKSAK